MTSTARAADDGALRQHRRRAPADKHDERRPARRLGAAHAGELGYARAACGRSRNNSEFSHGVVHYYFDDKLELIVYCVRQYKATCVRRTTASSPTP